MEKVVIIKTIGGEEIIGQVPDHIYRFLVNDVDTPQQRFSIYHPRVIAPVQTGPNQFGLSLVPMFMSKPDAREVVINRDLVLAVLSSVPVELEKEYLSATSGLDLSSKMPVSPIIPGK